MRSAQVISLAWCGWGMNVPADWRPLTITGNSKKGSMIFGDSQRVVGRASWQRLRASDALAKVKRQANSRRLSISANDSSGKFTKSTAVHVGDDGSLFWCGYSDRSDIYLEITFRPESFHGIFNSVCLPSLFTDSPDQWTRWSVFNVSFQTPPTFEIQRHRLNVGDMSFLFQGPDGRRLLIRQVYPCSLALARKPMEDWLADRVYEERRRYKPLTPPEPWLPSHSEELRGWIQRGVLRYPFPLGWIASRRTLAGILRDPDLERLLIVWYDSPEMPDDTALEAVFSGMNWAKA